MTRTSINISIEQIEEVLPQTQCRNCGYNGCKPYAEALLLGESINRCTPGGAQVINELAQLLQTEVLPLHSECQPKNSPHTVIIEEEHCIGCTKCIQACPMDAIIGAAKQMHTVITSDCTGCDLCIEPCPVDCIRLLPSTEEENKDALKLPNRRYRKRLFERRQNRLTRLTKIRETVRRDFSTERKAKFVNNKAGANKQLVLNALLAQKKKLQRLHLQAKDKENANRWHREIERLEEKIIRIKQ